jgi:acetoin utilization protein AcuB
MAEEKMFVSKSMTRKVISIDKDADVLQAKEKMDRYLVRHLPVVDKNNRLIGIVSDRDIRSAFPSILMHDYLIRKERERLSAHKIKDIMTIDPVTVSPLDTIQDVLLLVQENRVGAFPVVDEKGILKGIISVRDLIRTFINVLGIGEPGTLLCVVVEEKIGQMKKVVDAITEEKISFGSILVARHWEEEKRVIFPYLLTLDVSKIKKKLTKMGYSLLDPMDWDINKLSENE